MTAQVLLFLGLLVIPQSLTPPKKQGNAYLEWWKKDTFFTILDLSTEKKDLIINKLARIEVDIWADQTQIKQLKIQFKKHFKDSDIDNNTIREEWNTELAPLRKAIEDRKLAAHLFVRKTLSTEEFQHLLELHPHFFDKPWFKRSKLRVFKGKVKK